MADLKEIEKSLKSSAENDKADHALSKASSSQSSSKRKLKEDKVCAADVQRAETPTRIPPAGKFARHNIEAQQLESSKSPNLSLPRAALSPPVRLSIASNHRIDYIEGQDAEDNTTRPSLSNIESSLEAYPEPEEARASRSQHVIMHRHRSLSASLHSELYQNSALS